MISCQHCQPSILDYLYGLLDEPEAIAVEAHLRECASCAAARAEAAKLQGLFARAAKAEFPQVRFDPATIQQVPSAASKSRLSSRSLPSPLAEPSQPANGKNASLSGGQSSFAGRASRRGIWIAWAIAAGVMLAIPGTVIPVLSALNQAELAGKATDDSIASASAAMDEVKQAANADRKQRTDAEFKLANAKQIQESLFASWVADEKTVIQTQTAQKMPVDVIKPASAQPGAPNDFFLVLRDHALAPNTRLIAEVRDQTDAVVYSQRLPEQRDSRYALHLPAETWTKLTPQSELFLVVSSEDDKTGQKLKLQDKVPLFGPVYTTMLATDRSTYHPGEMLYFRSLTLDRTTFQPPNHELFFRYELSGPQQHPITFRREVVGGSDLVREQGGKVETIVGPDGKPIRGVGCGSMSLPPDLKDGDYTLQLTELPHPAGYAPGIPFGVTRSIKVRSGAVDEFAKQIGFEAASYSAGDTVAAWAELKFQDQPVSQAEVKVVALADNAQLHDIAAGPTGPDGRTHFRFKLPRNLNKGDVRVKVTFTIKGQNIEESAVERVPVVGRSLNIEFFPEGGTQVAGVPCRVYVRATTPDGDPVDIRGTITDGRKTLARVQTLTDQDQPGTNRGLGSFTYIPALGTSAWLRLESPSEAFAPFLPDAPLSVAPSVVAGLPVVIAARSGFPLPKPVDDGVVMSVVNPVSSPREPIRVNLRSAGESRHLIVGAYTRGRLSDTKRITTDPRQISSVALMAGQDQDPRGGVVRITVFEEPREQTDGLGKVKTDIKPIAERLVFRKPSEALKLSIATSGTRTDSGAFAANTPIEMTINATDEKEKPTAAILWAAAVNTGSAPGKKDRLINTHFLLAGEVTTPDGLEYADFLLTTHPKAEEALDLVLATQGWRHFVEQTVTPVAPFRGAANLLAERSSFLTTSGHYPTRAEQPGMREHRKLYETYWPRYEAASKALSSAQAACDAMAADKNSENRIRELVLAADRAASEVNAANERARKATDPVERLRGAGWYGVAGFGLLAVMLGILAFARPLGRLPYGIGTVGSVGLVAFLVITLGMAEQTLAAIEARHEAIAKSTQNESPIHSRMAEGKSKDAKLDEKLSDPQLKSQDAAMPAGVMQNGKPGAASTASKSSAGGFGGLPKMAPSSSDKGAPPQAPGAMMPVEAMKPASAALPAPAGPVPAPGGYGAPRPDFPPKNEVTVPAPPGAGGLGSSKEKDGGNWQSVGPRKYGPDWDLSERSALRAALPQARAMGEGEADRLKRVDGMAKKSSPDRAKAESEKLNEGKRREGFKEDRPNNGFMTRMAGKDNESASNADQIALNRVKSTLRNNQTTPPLIVREYAAPRPGTEGVDNELSDTILWQPVIVLPGDGKAKLNFTLGAARGGYQVVIAGHTLDGRIGAIREVIAVSPSSATAMPPLAVPPKLP
jgi:anti-sigma factor RsiW